jgi:hypothetical protein
MKRINYIFCIILSGCFISAGASQSSPNSIDFFDSEELLEMTLYFDVHEFIRTKSDPRNFDALLTVKTLSGDSVSETVKIKARGEMRRKYCAFPPLMIKFSDTRLKLVTHCNQTELHENYVFREYLAYRLFNLVTNYSFKTRLVHINYVDINNPKRSVTAYGFLIENEDDMAERNGAKVLESDKISQKHMDELDMTRVALFNYMIGNTDWSVLQQHNIKILMPVDTFTNKGIPVAYDFDYSGFVKTAYSAPSSSLPIKAVTERYYMGSCISMTELETVLQEFESLRETFINTIQDFKYLNNPSKKKLEYYINGFFKEQKHKDMMLAELNKTCRKY